MQELYFRAWDQITGQMGVVKSLKFYPTDVRMLILDHVKGGAYEVSRADAPVMQFTGLQDKNGKEIYERDVLCVFDEDIVPVTDEGQGPVEPCNHIVQVEMRAGVWGFEIPKTDDGETSWYGLHYWVEDISSEGYEVIGNIYENPDLLMPTNASAT